MKRRDWRTDLAAGLIVTTTIFMSVPLWAALNAPATVIRDWQFFLPFVVLPYGAGIVLLVWAKRTA